MLMLFQLFQGYFARQRLFAMFSLRFCAGNWRVGERIDPRAHARRSTAVFWTGPHIMNK